MHRDPSRRLVLGGLAAGLLLPGLGRAQEASKTVLILVRKANTSDQAVVDGFKQGLPNGTVVTFELGEDVDEAAAALATEMRGFPVDLVFCIGDVAALAALREFSSVPLVVSNVTRSVTPAGAPVAEVPNRVDPASVADLALALKGKAARVGVLRANGASPEYWPACEAAFAAKGVKLTLSPVVDSRAVIQARAEALSHESDVLWIDGSPAIAGADVSAICRFAHGLKVPVLGFDPSQFSLPDAPDLVLVPSAAGVGGAAATQARKLLGQSVEGASAWPAAGWIGSRVGLRDLAVPLTKDLTSLVSEWR